LKNVGEKVRSELKGKEHKATRTTLMEQAALIYRAPDAEAAHQLVGEWSQKWCPQAPEAVAALEPDVEHTLVFYQLDTVACAWIRTTSLLERTNRELHRKFRQAVTSGSILGANAAVYLQVQRLHACWTKANWWDVSHALYFSLADLYP
jgi:transposase-like protein